MYLYIYFFNNVMLVVHFLATFNIDHSPFPCLISANDLKTTVVVDSRDCIEMDKNVENIMWFLFLSQVV